MNTVLDQYKNNGLSIEQASKDLSELVASGEISIEQASDIYSEIERDDIKRLAKEIELRYEGISITSLKGIKVTVSSKK